MPRSIKRPQTGSIVWYYGAAPPVGGPNAALVVNTVSPTLLGLMVFDRANGIGTYVASVPYHDGSRPASGAWCTHIRVNEPASGWPSDRAAHDYEEASLTLQQREARDERIAAEQQRLAATPLTPEQAAAQRQHDEYVRAAG